ncbi:MAG: sigma-70 family RNA polymerase sigma factor [Planctomycetota bacterium]
MVESPDDPLQRAREGDPKALEALLHRYEARLTEIAQRSLGFDLRARLHVSDVVQSAAADIVRDIRTFRGDDEPAFLAWATRILENKVRGKGRYFTTLRRSAPEQSLDALDETPANEQRTPSSEVGRGEEMARVAAVIQRLPDDYRVALLLRAVDGKSAREIGEQLGRTEQATRMLLHRARAALAAELAKDES